MQPQNLLSIFGDWVHSISCPFWCVHQWSPCPAPKSKDASFSSARSCDVYPIYAPRNNKPYSPAVHQLDGFYLRVPHPTALSGFQCTPPSVGSAASTPSWSPVRQRSWAGCPDTLHISLPGYMWGKSSASSTRRQNPIYQARSCPRGQICSRQHQSSRVLAIEKSLLLPGAMAVAAPPPPRFINHTSLFSLETQRSDVVLRMPKAQTEVPLLLKLRQKFDPVL